MTGQSDSNERLVIESEQLGSEQFVQLNVIRGFLSTTDEFGYSSNYSNGRDIQAPINGIKAIGKGNNISINTSDLSLSMNVANGFGFQTGFTITGGGALFQLGPDVVSQQQVRVGLTSMLTTSLGGVDGQLYMLATGGPADLLSSDNSRKLADRIVMQAIESVSSTRGRLGAMQRGTLEPTISALQDSMVAITEANAMITNADFAVESSNLMRLQLLVQAGAQTLGIANQLPQYAASLVR
jgi:flagellin